jgi:hypothetical protein
MIIVGVYLIIGFIIGVIDSLHMARTTDTMLKNINYLTDVNLLKVWRGKKYRKKVVILHILYNTFLWPWGLILGIKLAIELVKKLHIEYDYAELYGIEHADDLNDIDLMEEDKKLMEE